MRLRRLSASFFRFLSYRFCAYLVTLCPKMRFPLCWYCVAVVLCSVSAHYTVTLTVSTTVVLTSTQTATYSAVANKTTSSATKPSPTGVKNPKRGLAFAAGDTPGDLNNANQSASVISWQYNWADSPPDYLVESNIKYIPMQWGGAGLDSFADQVKAQRADTILTFNEPDFVSESNMDPVYAAKLWMTSIQPMKAAGVRLGGPAVTASDNGQQWLQAFLAACSGCTIDFLPLHWYGPGVEGFYSYIWQMHNTYPQYPIWITEYASTSTDSSVVADFLNQTITYMDTLDWIERYSWFGYFRSRPGVYYNLLGDDGSLNTLGQIYVGANTVHTQQRASPTKVYHTVDGADMSNQPLVTTWAPYPNSALRGLNRPGQYVYQMACMVLPLLGGVLGGLWVIL